MSILGTRRNASQAVTSTNFLYGFYLIHLLPSLDVIDQLHQALHIPHREWDLLVWNTTKKPIHLAVDPLS